MQQDRGREPPSFLLQTKEFFKRMGIFTKVMIAFMLVVYILTYAIPQSQRKVSMLFGMNYDAIINGHQYYRIFTAAVCHGPIMHIGFNLATLAIFGIQFEKSVGTLFFAAINLWLLLIATAIHLFYQFVLIYLLPEGLGGG